MPEYLGALLNYYDGKTSATRQSDVSAELAKVLPADFTLLDPPRPRRLPPGGTRTRQRNTS